MQDIFGIPVRYPFGYSLSYTEFQIRAREVSCLDGMVRVRASVTNTGKLGGKEVIHCYVSLPDHGDYVVLVGNSSDDRDLKSVASLSLPEDEITIQCENKCVPAAEDKEHMKLLVPGEGVRVANGKWHAQQAGQSAFKIDIGDIESRRVEHREYEFVETEEEKNILDGLTLEEMAEFLTDLVMPGSEEDRKRILEAVESGALKSSILRRSAARVLRMMLYSHTHRK